MSSDLIENEWVVFKSVCNRKWSKATYDQDAAFLMQQKKGIDAVLAEMLSRRSVTHNDVDDFLNPKLKNSLPDLGSIKDMDKGVDVVFSAIKAGRKIAVLGDYDVDGATSSALLKRFFDSINTEIDIYIPDRVLEGYGPNIDAFKKLKKKEVDLIITVDCGTASHDVIYQGKEMGFDIVVLDHHLAESSNLPNADAVINPNRSDDNSGLNDLAAVGVSFLFVIALLKRMINDGSPSSDQSKLLLQLLDIVALGTVCDVVPLVGLNRVFVKQGLKVMSATQNVGIKALIDLLGIKGTITPYHLGFVLGPRINAGGRVGKSSLGVELLTVDDYQKAYEVAVKLDSFNSERKLIESNVLKQAMEQAFEIQNDNCLIVSGKGWHQGVIGIVASRIQDKYSKPVIVISFDDQGIGKASCRSIEGVNIGEIIAQAYQERILLAGGGHSMAAGFSIEQAKLEGLRCFLEAKVLKKDINKVKNKTFTYESFISSNHVNLDFIHKINMLGPFGNGNELPKFMLRKIVITNVNIFQSSHISCIIKDADNIVSSSFKAIAFRAIDSPMGELLLSKGKVLNVIVTLNINHWNNQQKPEAIIVDVIE